MKLKVGDRVPTPYSDGTLVLYREVDKIYKIQLDSGAILYCPGSCFEPLLEHQHNARVDEQNTKLNAAYESLEAMRKLNLEVACQERGIPMSVINHDVCAACLLASAPAFETCTIIKPETASAAPLKKSSSSMRQATIFRGLFRRSSSSASESSTTTSSSFVDESLRDDKSQHQKESETSTSLQQAMSTTTTTTTTPVTTPKTTKKIVRKNSKGPPVPTKKSPQCLTCATPSCRNHSSKDWRKHRGIDMCQSCESVFGINFVISLLTTTDRKQQQKLIDHVMDMYDRISILLRYSYNYMEEIADSLDKRTTRNQVWGIGSSSAGMISGVLGLAATATFFTPAGPPLMIASLIFGGSASAVQTGADVRLHTSEPNKMADKIIALYGALHAIVRVVNTLRDALVRDHLNDQQLYIFDDEYESEQLRKKIMPLSETVQEIYEQNRVSILTAATATRGSAALVLADAATVTGAASTATTAAAEMGSFAGKNARFFSRGSVAAASTALTFAQFAGGVLSAATLVLEARSMNHTINTFNDGSSKSKQLRYIKKSILLSYENSDNNDTISSEPVAESTDEDSTEIITKVPSTKELDSEIHTYLNILRHRIRAMTEAEVTKLLLEQNEEILLEEESAVVESFEKGDDDELFEAPFKRNNNDDDGTKQNLERTDKEESVKLTSATLLLRRIEKQKQQQLQSSTSKDNDGKRNTNDDNNGNRITDVPTAEHSSSSSTGSDGPEQNDNDHEDDDDDVVSWTASVDSGISNSELDKTANEIEKVEPSVIAADRVQ